MSRESGLLDEKLVLAISKVESILRGKTKLSDQEMQSWIEECYVFYRLVSSKAAITMFEGIPTQEKFHYLEGAIKLYNKLRNVPPHGFQEVKTLLKGACAWLFSLFAERNGKSLSVLLKTLSRCGADFFNVYHKTDMAVECYDAVISFWETAADIDVFRDLPPLELQFIKICVFSCMLFKLGVFFNAQDHKALKSLSTKALELLQSLPSRHKLQLVEKLQSFGQQMSQDDVQVLKAVSYFVQAHEILERMGTMKDLTLLGGQDDKEEKASLMRDVMELKIKVNLYLVFSYAKEKSVSKAVSHIDAIERIQKGDGLEAARVLEHSILFAKLLVAVAQRDLEGSFSCAKLFIQHPQTNFESALSIVKTTTNLVGEVASSELESKFAELYKLMSLKYPNEPEFTLIRINYLQSTLAIVQVDEAHGSKPFDVANRLVTDHVNGVRILSSECIEQLRGMFLRHIDWLRDRKLFQVLNDWCDLLITFLESGQDKHVDTLLSVKLVKVTALMNMRDYGAALSTACKALYSMHNLRTVIAVFRALLHYEGIAKSSIVQHFLKHLYQSAKQSVYKIGDEDYLHELSVCCCVVEQSPNLHTSYRNLIIEQLLHAWITLYHTKRVWKGSLEGSLHIKEADEHKDESDCNFFEAVLLYCSYAMKAALVDSEGGFHGEFTGGKIREIEGGKPGLVSSAKSDAEEGGMDVSSPIVPANSYRDAVQFCSNLVEREADVDLGVAIKILHMIKVVPDVFDGVKALIGGDDWESIENILGSAEHLLYLANLCVLLAEALVQNKRASFMQQVRETSPERLARSLQCLDVAATFYQLASTLYVSLPNANCAEYLRRHMGCLLQSCAANLDAYQVQLYCIEADITLPTRVDEGNTGNLEDSQAVEIEQQGRIRRCRSAAELLESLLLKMAEFADEEDIKMLCIMLLLHFSSYCLSGSTAECEQFIEKKKGIFMRASGSVLNDCVTIASSSHVCSTDTLRQLITCTLQACLGHSKVCYRLVGSFYRRLIELAPSRKYALSKIEEIEQLLREVICKKKNQQDDDSFDQFDIDQIFTLTYNYGVTLLDLDQLSLAENFMTKAAKLLPYTSTEMQMWEERIKDALQHLQSLQAASTGLNLPINEVVASEDRVGKKRTADDALLPASPNIAAKVLTLESMRGTVD
eukprot:gene24462-29565_t